jgi:hypothetical protein
MITGGYLLPLLDSDVLPLLLGMTASLGAILGLILTAETISADKLSEATMSLTAPSSSA